MNLRIFLMEKLIHNLWFISDANFFLDSWNIKKRKKCRCLKFLWLGLQRRENKKYFCLFACRTQRKLNNLTKKFLLNKVLDICLLKIIKSYFSHTFNLDLASLRSSIDVITKSSIDTQPKHWHYFNKKGDCWFNKKTGKAFN